jgi:hypothetical protein
MRILGIAALVDRTSDLPKDTQAAVEILLDPKNRGLPRTALSLDLQRFYKDLPQRCESALAFLLSEVDVPQGSGGCVFINSLPIVEALGHLRDEISVELLPPEYFTGHWQSRYSGLDNMKGWANFSAALASERDAIESCLAEIRRELVIEGYTARDGSEDLGSVYSRFLGDVAFLSQVLKETRQSVPHSGFERLFKEEIVTGPGSPTDANGPVVLKANSSRRTVILNSVSAAEAIVGGKSDRALLIYDAAPLAQARDALRIVTDFIAIVRREVDTKVARITGEGDPDLLLKRLRNGLDQLAQTATTYSQSGSPKDLGRTGGSGQGEEDEDVEAA